MPDVDVVRAERGSVRLRLAVGTGMGDVVSLAGRVPEIVAFTYEPPTLSELFRRAVA